jgi:hypothetical protein
VCRRGSEEVPVCSPGIRYFTGETSLEMGTLERNLKIVYIYHWYDYNTHDGLPAVLSEIGCVFAAGSTNRSRAPALN